MNDKKVKAFSFVYINVVEKDKKLELNIERTRIN